MKHPRVTIASAVSVGALAASAWGVSQYYQTDLEANAAHAELAEYDEIGKLELERENTELEIKYILGITERRALEVDETDRLDYLRIKRVNLEERLRDLQSRQGAQ